MTRKRRDIWFERRFVGATPVSWEGLTLLFGGIGVGFGLMELADWMTKQPAWNAYAGICYLLFVVDILTIFIVGHLHTGDPIERNQSDARDRAKVLFRTKR